MVSHYHKLCSHVPRIRGNHRGQLILRAIDEPHAGKHAFVIMASPLPSVHNNITFSSSHHIYFTGKISYRNLAKEPPPKTGRMRYPPRLETTA